MPTDTTPAPASQPSVGCERDDGLLNIHPESETCEVCQSSPAPSIPYSEVSGTNNPLASPDNETGRRVFDDPHGRAAARYPVQPSPARGDMPQECEDCGRSMTRCACSPARSDKDAERAAFEAWALAERVAYKDEQYGLCFYNSGSGAHQWIGWQARAAKAQESAPSSESCAECGLGCAPGVCIYGAANEITDVLGLFARRATAGPSSEVSFDAFWSDEVARNGGHGFGADYKHWARKGFDAARRATAGTTAAPTCPECKGRGYTDSGDPETGATMLDYVCQACATAGNAAPTEIPTRLDVLSLIREHGHRCYVAGVNCAEVEPKYMTEIESALRSLTTSDALCDGRACIASNAEAAPAIPEGKPLDVSRITSVVRRHRAAVGTSQEEVIVKFGRSKTAANTFLDQFGALVLGDRHAAPSNPPVGAKEQTK